MSNLKPNLGHPRLVPYALVAAAAWLATWGVVGAPEPYFARFLGDWPPWLVVGLVGLIGAGLLGLMQARWQFPRDQRHDLGRGLAIGAAFATPLAIPPVLIDLAAPFPREINVPWPWSIAFYPAIAFVVEVVFHLVPWAILLGLGAGLATWLGRMGKAAVVEHLSPGLLVTGSLLLVSLTEPVFQVVAGWSPTSPTWVDVLVGVNVWAFNVGQLAICRRFGFVAMYLTRLVFYLFWHLLWGHWRLELLF